MLPSNIPCESYIDIKSGLKLVKHSHRIAHVLLIVQQRVITDILKNTPITYKVIDAHRYPRSGWLCFMSHRQRDHLETTTPFTVPCKGWEAQFLHRSRRVSNPGPSRGSPLHYRCVTPD